MREKRSCASPIDGAVAVAHRAPVERVAERTDEPLEHLLEPFGRVHGQTVPLEAVAVHHVQAVDVDAVIGMAVRDHDRGQVAGVDVLVQVRERPVAAVHPDVRVAGAHEIAAARAAGRRAVRTRTSEHGQLHDHASTAFDLGPAESRAQPLERLDVAAGHEPHPIRELARPGCRTRRRCEPRTRSPRRSTRATTSGPITSAIVRASSG